MTHNLLDYPGRMRRSGHRVTPQRKAILDAICGFGRRVSVEEILLRLRRNSPALDRATLYRNLTFLEEMRLVDATGRGKRRIYEIASLHPHHHLVCRGCGKEEDLDSKTVDRFRESIRRNRGFLIDGDHLTFHGLCSHCSSGGSRNTKRANIRAA